jgi:hypothetical protein
MLGKSSEGADVGEGLRSRMERVVFRDGYGRVRQCSVDNWVAYLQGCKNDGYEPEAVELCRVGSREEAMRFVNLAKGNEDGEI